MLIEGENNRQANQNNQRQPNQNQPVVMTKRQMKDRISNRQDFVLLFGLERLLKSWLLSSSKKIYYLAIHYKGPFRGKGSFEAITNQDKYSSPKNQRSNN